MAGLAGPVPEVVERDASKHEDQGSSREGTTTSLSETIRNLEVSYSLCSSASQFHSEWQH